MNIDRRKFIKAVALAGIAAVTLPSTALAMGITEKDKKRTPKFFKSVNHLRQYVISSSAYFSGYTKGKRVCRHIAGDLLYDAWRDNFFMGIFWIKNLNHWACFTCTENGHWYHIEPYTANVSPLMGWENYEFDWMPSPRTEPDYSI